MVQAAAASFPLPGSEEREGNGLLSSVSLSPRINFNSTPP